MDELEIVTNGITVGFSHIGELMALLGVSKEWDIILKAMQKVSVHGNNGDVRLGLVEKIGDLEMVA